MVESRPDPLEEQLEYVISENLDRFREQLKRLDKSNTGTIDKHQMKGLIEDFLQFTLRPDEYHQLSKHFPIDQYGFIKYNDYLNLIVEHIHSKDNIQQQHPTNRSRLLLVLVLFDLLIDIQL